MKISKIRGFTILLFIVLAVIALIFHTGSGNLSSFGIDAIAYICPLGALESMLASWTLIPRPIIVLIVVFIFAVVFGKVFCAWVCPIPPIKHFFDRKAWRIQKQPSKKLDTAAEDGKIAVAAELEGEAEPPEIEAGVVENKVDVAVVAACEPKACGTKGCTSCAEKRKKLDSRHIVLGGALLSTAAFGFPVFCLVCPVGLVFASIIVWWRFVGFAELTITLLVFPAMLLLEILVLRKWCLKFCPLGALMSLLSLPNKLFRPKVNMEKCLRNKGIECTDCVKNCGEGLDPHYEDGMHECTKCGECVDRCPAQAIKISVR